MVGSYLGLFVLFGIALTLVVGWCNAIKKWWIAKKKVRADTGQTWGLAPIGSPEQLQRYEFSKLVRDVFDRDHPEWTPAQGDLAFYGLREFFLLLRLDGDTPDRIALGMPSVLVDAAWHAFLLCTEEYQAFCLRYFGKIIHHRPDPTAQPTTMDASSAFSNASMMTWIAYRRFKQHHGSFLKPSFAGYPFLFEVDRIAGVFNGWIWTEAAFNALDRKISRTSKTSTLSADGSTNWAVSSDSPSSSGDHHHASGHSCSSAGHSGGHSCGGGSSCGSSCGGGSNSSD